MADIKMSAMAADVSLDGTEKLLGLDGTTSKTVTVDTLSAYVIDDLLDSTAQESFVPTDDILIERSDTEYKVPVSAMTDFVVDAAFDYTAVTSAELGDLFVLERDGDTKTITVDHLKDYIEPSQSDMLDLSGLSDRTPAGADTLAICNGSTPGKVSLTNLETKLWGDLNTYVTGLDAVATAEDSDFFRVNQDGDEKKVTASTLATYFMTQVDTTVIESAWPEDEVDPAVSGDTLVLNREDVLKAIDVDTVGDYAIARLGLKGAVTTVATGDDFPIYVAGVPHMVDATYISSYVLGTIWDATTDTELEAGDELALGRAGTTKNITYENFVSEIQANILDYSGHTTASLTTADKMLVVQGTTPLKTTIADLETKLWADRLTYVSGLAKVTMVQDTDILHVNQSGDKYVTPVELAAYVKTEIGDDVLAGAFGEDKLETPASGDLFIMDRSGTAGTMDIDKIAAHAVTTLGGSSDSGGIADDDDFVLYRSGTSYLGDVADIVTYVVGKAFDSTVVSSAASGDLLVLESSGVAKTITVDNLKTFVEGTTSLDVSGLDTATLTTADEMLVCQSGEPQKTTIAALETQLWTDFATYAGGLSDAASVVGADKFYMLHSGSPVYATGTELATYINGIEWTGASSAASLNGSDTFLIQQTGTTYTTTLTDIASEIMGVSQADILDISGLDPATLNTSDLIPVCQGTTARYTTVSDLSDEAHDAFASYVIGRDPIATTLAADKIHCLQSGVSKYVTPETLAAYHYDYIVEELEGLTEKTTPVADDVLLLQDSENGDALKRSPVKNFADELRWRTVDLNKYTGCTTAGIGMTDTSDITIGMPLRYSYNGNTYYGIATSVTVSFVYVAGEPLTAVYDLTDLAIGTPELVRQVNFNVDWYYGDTVQDILSNVANQNFRWHGGKAHLVEFSAAHHWPDSGIEQPVVTVKIDGTSVMADGTYGVQMSPSADTWISNAAGYLSATACAIEHNDPVEVSCTAVGTNGDADSLTVSCLFVYE